MNQLNDHEAKLKEDLKARLAAIAVVKTLEELVGSGNSQDPGFHIRPEGMNARAVSKLPDGYNGSYITISAESGIEIGIHYNSGSKLIDFLIVSGSKLNDFLMSRPSRSKLNDFLMSRPSGIHCLIKLPDQITNESPTSLKDVKAAIEKTLPNEERYGRAVPGVPSGKIAYPPEAAAAEGAIYLVSGTAVSAILGKVGEIAKSSNPHYRELMCGGQAGRR